MTMLRIDQRKQNYPMRFSSCNKTFFKLSLSEACSLLPERPTAPSRRSTLHSQIGTRLKLKADADALPLSGLRLSQILASWMIRSSQLSNVYIHTYIHIYIHTYIHIYIHTYIHNSRLISDYLPNDYDLDSLCFRP